MDLQLETVACDLCNDSAATVVTNSIDHEHGVPGSFNVVRCSGCGLHYLNPRPTAASIGQCYPGDYYAYSASAQAVAPSKVRRMLKRRIRSSARLSALANRIPSLRHLARDADIADDVPGWIAPGKVLDVGCGSGGFLDGMRDNGWATFGIEPGAAAAATARTKGHVIACQSATAPLDPEITQHRFDVVLMSHSLEHVHSPTQALRNIHPLLRPKSGHLIVEVPNLESLLTFWFGELGLAFDTPRHLYMFGPATLRSLLEKTGFQVRAIRHIARPVQFVRCLRLLSSTGTSHPWARAAEVSLSDKNLLRALEPLSEFAVKNQLGGAIRVVATRV